jgi:hypothetical protein
MHDFGETAGNQKLRKRFKTKSSKNENTRQCWFCDVLSFTELY